MSKIYRFNQLDKMTKELEGEKTVLVGGCFDVFHYGHLTFLQKAKEAGGKLIVALESDEFIRSTKKRLPIHQQRERAEILAALTFVDKVVLLPFWPDKVKYWDLVKKIQPEVIAITQGDPRIKEKEQQAKTVGGLVKAVSPLIKKFSSSKIVNYEIISGD